MYSAQPQVHVGGSGLASDTLHIVRTERRVFGSRPHARLPVEEAASLDVYLSDLVRPHGLALREGAEREEGHWYEEVAEDLIAAMVPPDQPVDLVVLTFDIPDARVGRTAATYRGSACPGDPLAFAICDQGPAAAFTGLRLVGELARTGGCPRSLLLMVEQPTLPYPPAAPVAMPARPAAVALLCGESGPARVATERQHAGVTPERVGAVLAGELAELGGDLPAGTAVTLVLGGGLAAESIDTSIVDQVRVAPAGQPHTGVWWQLCESMAESSVEGRRVVLAEYDRVLRYLCLCAVDIQQDHNSARAYE